MNYKRYYIETSLNEITWLMITFEHVQIGPLRKIPQSTLPRQWSA